ncbi:MAG: PrgI family protein [Candidatus Pacebacteria bacterium]|jgi:hypothetical protein|nr:PrgI family protein [Candidatus Paceibacterota bacterium]
MRFEVPQFIDVEDKIFGPFTFKQFLYLAGGAGIIYVLWKLLPAIIAIPLILPVAGLALALTFYKVNGRPFAQTIESWMKYITQDKLYLWKKRERRKTPEKTPMPETEQVPIQAPRLSGSKLKDIAWSLDVLDMQENAKLDKLDTR